jgi:hypothetical protein
MTNYIFWIEATVLCGHTIAANSLEEARKQFEAKLESSEIEQIAYESMHDSGFVIESAEVLDDTGKPISIEPISNYEANHN